MLTGKNYIGNQLSGNGFVKFKTFNPKLNQENKQIFVEASNEEIDRAVGLASTAFKVYSSITREAKANFLTNIADEILALDQNLIDIYCIESGLPVQRAIIERTRTINQLRMFADLVLEGSWVEAKIEEGDLARSPVPKPDLRKMLIPLGPVVVFGASNFPLAYSTAGGDTAAALASGCPVIVKSHPMHAGTGELISSAIIKAAIKSHMPNGVFSNLNSTGISVGKTLVQHPSVKAIGFTGSMIGGRAIYNMATQRPEPIPVFAEMGSINPTVILPNALILRGAKIAKTYANAITMGTGQFCTNPGLILGIKGADLDCFIKLLSSEILDIKPYCMLHPNIAKNYITGSKNAMVQEGVTIGAKYNGPIKDNYASQTVLTVDGSRFIHNKTLHQEVFGPFSIVVQCQDTKELLQIVEQLEGQLTGTIFGEVDEINNDKSIINALKERVGRLIFNGVSNGVEVCPAMQHGGPYPASTDSRFTAVGVDSIKRWVRPVTYQNCPNELLPVELRDENEYEIVRK